MYAVVKIGGHQYKVKEDQTLFVNRLNTDRKSTRLNSSHVAISYAVFCLKKKQAQQVVDDMYIESGTGLVFGKALLYVKESRIIKEGLKGLWVAARINSTVLGHLLNCRQV